MVEWWLGLGLNLCNSASCLKIMVWIRSLKSSDSSEFVHPAMAGGGKSLVVSQSETELGSSSCSFAAPCCIFACMFAAKWFDVSH